MNYSIGADLGVTISNLAQVRDGLFFRESAFGGNEFGKVSPLAKFSNNIGIIFGGVNVVYFDDVASILESLEYVYFGCEQTLMDIPLKHAHVDHFDRYCFICNYYE